MAVIRNLVVKISADISSLSKGLQSAQKKLSNVSKSLTKIGSNLTAKVTAPIIALGSAIIKTSSQFEQSMANAASVAGATGEELEKMTALAREMGSKTVFSASEAADALYYMASAGYGVEQMTSSIEPILNLASATQYGLAQTTDAVIATLNQFGLEASEAERVTNVFASAIGNSMANMEKLSNSMGYVGPVANSLGYSIEEVTGVLSVLYNAGYDGSQAGTTLRQALVSLMNPTSSALAVFEELGLTTEELDPAINSLADIIDRLGTAGMTTSDAMKVFGARGGPGMLALIGQGADAVRYMTASITGTSKATDMAEVQLDTLAGQLKIVKSEIQEIAISFGDVIIPILRSFISKYVSPLTNKLMKLSDAQKNLIVKVAGIAAAIGPAFLVLGKVVGGVSSLIKLIPLLGSKVALIIGAIALVVSGLVALFKNNEEFRNKVNEIFASIKEKVLNVLNVLKNWWEKNGERILERVGHILTIVGERAVEALEEIYRIFKKVAPYIKRIITAIFTTLESLWNENGEAVVSAISSAIVFVKEIIDEYLTDILDILESTVLWALKAISVLIQGIVSLVKNNGTSLLSKIGSFIKNALSVIFSFLSTIKEALSGFFDNFEGIWQSIKEMISSLWNLIVTICNELKPLLDALDGIILVLFAVVSGVINGIIDMFGPLVQAVSSLVVSIVEIIMGLISLLTGDFSGAWEHVKKAGLSFWETIKHIGEAFVNLYHGVIEGFTSFFNKNSEKIKDKFSDVGEYIIDWWSNLVSGVKFRASQLWDTTKELFLKIKDWFAELISDAFNWGKNLVSNITDGIKNAWDKVKQGVCDIAQSIKDFLGFGSPTKKGPGHTADKWIPNLMDMMKEGLYDSIPMLKTALTEVASTLGLSSTINQQVVSEGTSPFGDLLNGLFQLSSVQNREDSNNSKDIVLEIDGQTFARLIAPKLSKEYKRNGILLREI